jgi:hypothetical protein
MAYYMPGQQFWGPQPGDLRLTVSRSAKHLYCLCGPAVDQVHQAGRTRHKQAFNYSFCNVRNSATQTAGTTFSPFQSRGRLSRFYQGAEYRRIPAKFLSVRLRLWDKKRASVGHELRAAA